MALATFGAILGYALEMEAAAETLYRRAATHTHEPLFEEIAAQASRRSRRIERLRREGVAEMILESIDGLKREEFSISFEAADSPPDSFRQAVQVEATRHRFYLAAAEKLPIREVARDLQRLAQENRENMDRLQERLSGP